MAESPVGDLVRLEQNQRLDYVDLKAFQVLQYELMADILGGLFGESSGCVTLPSFTWNAGPKTVSIGETMLFGAKVVAGATARLRGIVMPFNPSGSYAGSAQIDLSAHSAGGNTPFLWFARDEVVTERKNRWKYIGGRERIRAVDTRIRQYLRFGASPTSDEFAVPNADHTWHRFAKVVGWNAGAPIITPVSLWDFGVVPVLEDGNNTPLPYAGMSLYRLRQAGGLAVYRQSLPQILTFLAQRVANLRTKDWTFTSALEAATSSLRKLEENTVRGVDELHAGLVVVEDIVSAQPKLLTWGNVGANGQLTGNFFDGLEKRWVNGTQSESDARVGAVYDIRIVASYTVSHVEVTPKASPGSAAASYNVEVIAGSPNHTVRVEMLQEVETTVHEDSDGIPLPVGTIDLVEAGSFPDGPGQVMIETSAGLQVVSYTARDGNQLTGCAGGTGNLATGNVVRSMKPVPHIRGFWVSIYGS